MVGVGVGHRAGGAGLASEGLTPKDASKAALSWWAKCPRTPKIGGLVIAALEGVDF